MSRAAAVSELRRAAVAACTGIVAASITAVLSLGAYAAIAHVPDGEQQLPGGIKLEVTRLSAPPGGRLIIATVPLDPAVISLYLTPPAADHRPGSRDDLTSWTYRLTHTATAAQTARTHLMVNGLLFAGGSWPVRRPGELARLTETAVIDGKVYARWEHSYMLGFLPDLTPAPVRTKPPPGDDVMAAWALGISAQSWQMFAGERGWWEQASRRPRTVVGVNPERRLLWLAVCDEATLAEAAEPLVTRGATYVLHLDGGGSTAMAVNGRAVFGDWRPVLNHFGLRLKHSPQP